MAIINLYLSKHRDSHLAKADRSVLPRAIANGNEVPRCVAVPSPHGRACRVATPISVDRGIAQIDKMSVGTIKNAFLTEN